MQDLTIALIQADLIWEDHKANLTRFESFIDRVPNDVQLIVLPEMFSTGFSMQADRLAQTMDGSAVVWMVERAQATGADIAGSLIIKENASYYNRLIWAKPDGTLAVYDKRHLFRYAGEEKIYTSGKRQLLVNCHGWNIRPFICYDLRFPIWTRNINNTYDAAIFVANWPERRAPHWNALLKARAIENQCYVAGVNRVGVDGNGLCYQGDTSLIDPMGRSVATMRHNETIVTGVLSASVLADYRHSFPAWMDADGEMAVWK